MSHDDDLAMVRDLDALRARMIERNDPEDCRAYWRAVGEVEARLNVRADGPRRALAMRRGVSDEERAA